MTVRQKGVMGRTGSIHDAGGLEAIEVRAVMHEGVLSCSSDAPLSAVAELMSAERVHCVVVDRATDEPSTVWGVISDLDLVAAANVRDLDAQAAGGSAASPAVKTVPDDTLRRAAQLMTEHATSHLIVVDPTSGRPVGVISTLDIARALAERSRR
jgi:CBS domain-containing protein